MEAITLIIGIFALMYGLYTVYARLKTPDKLTKLEAMKNFYGDKKGIIIHTISYSILPILVGILFIYLGINGISIL